MSKKEHPIREAKESQHEPQTPLSEPSSPAPELQEGLVESLIREKEELKNAYLRLSADMDNYRKRIQKEKEEYHKYALKSLIENLLPVWDNLERSLKAEGSDGTAIKQGVSMILAQFESILTEAGLCKIELKAGDEFDPQSAEALMMEDKTDAEHPFTVAEVFETGWRIGDYVLRTAKVKVYKR